MKLNQSGEDYLEAILILKQKCGIVRSIDVAEYLNVTKPSVSNAIKLLKQGRFITKESDVELSLTKMGKEIAEKIYERHLYFGDRLICAGVDPVIAEQEACLMEHTISDKTFKKLKGNMSNKETG